MSQKQLGLYIHSPFCRHKCGYCDFNSWAQKSNELHLQWLGGIETSLRRWKETLSDVELSWKTVFMGGGTPSLLSREILLDLGRLFDQEGVLSSALSEFTVEVNPEDLDEEKLATFREMGATRISMGVQSFRQVYLDRLERQASVERNLQALELLGKHWSGSWSLDLMYALPGQTLGEFEEDLSLALQFSPPHISLYQLTLSTERSRNWEQAPESELADFFALKRDRLLPLGYDHYEVSNFAKKGMQSRHNRLYWELGEFMGLGPGAYGLVSSKGFREKPTEMTRFGGHQKAPSKFETWLMAAGKEPAGELVELRTPRMHLQELLLMGLRLREGVSCRRLGKKVVEALLAFPKLQGLLEAREGAIFCTEKGLYLLDTTVKNCFLALEALGDALDSEEIDPTFGQ